MLIPATVEGGPMSLLEGLGMGKPIIAPDDVGMVPEFGDTEHIRRYPTGNTAALIQVVRQCYEEKLARTRLVQDRTWDHWLSNRSTATVIAYATRPGHGGSVRLFSCPLNH